MADQAHLAILWLGTFELAREKGCQEFALLSDAIGTAAEICGISKQLNVELLKKRHPSKEVLEILPTQYPCWN